MGEGEIVGFPDDQRSNHPREAFSGQRKKTIPWKFAAIVPVGEQNVLLL